MNRLSSTFVRLSPRIARNVVLPCSALVIALIAASCSEDASTPPDEDPIPRDCEPTANTICTWAGTGGIGFDGGGNHRLQSEFYWPIDISFMSTGDAYIIDWNNHKVRHVESDNTLRTVIGTAFVGDGPDDQSDQTPPGALGTTVNLNHPTEINELPNGTLLLTGWHTHKMRVYDPATELVMVTCGAGSGFGGDGGPARQALLNQPSQSAIAPDGTIFIVDQRNQRLRRIMPDATINTIVGTGVPGFGGDGGPPALAVIHQPFGSAPPVGGGVALDDTGRIYFSDILNYRIRRVDLANDIIETIAGTGVAGYGGDGGPATAAQVNNVRDLEFGPDGRLYFADEKNNRIRVIDLETNVVTTVVGNGTAGFTGDGGAPTDASLDGPCGMGFDANGWLYVADTNNQRIRRVIF